MQNSVNQLFFMLVDGFSPYDLSQIHEIWNKPIL